MKMTHKKRRRVPGNPAQVHLKTSHRCPQDPRGPSHEGPGEGVAELRGEEAPGVGAQAAAQPEVA